MPWIIAIIIFCIFVYERCGEIKTQSQAPVHYQQTYQPPTRTIIEEVIITEERIN